MTRTRTLTTALVALMILTGAIGIFASPRAAAQGDRPTLRFGLDAADIGTLDPHYASATQDRTTVDMVFNALIRYKPGNSAEFEPDLATAVPEPTTGTDGKQVWTFTLRTDAMCHASPQSESYALTADDVVYSLQKSATPERSAASGEYTGMAFAKVDATTVTITLDQPLAPLVFLPKVANYAGGFIICAQAAEAMGDEAIKTHPVGTGPFIFESYTPQNSIQLVANDAYFRGAPKLAGVDLRFVPDAASRELALQSNELDVIDGQSEVSWVERVDALDDLSVDVFGVGEVAFLNFNTTVAPLDNPLVRQAIAHAIDRGEHQALYGGAPVAENVFSVVPAQLLPGGLTEAEATAAGVDYPYDPARARELLTEANLADGFELDVVTSEMAVYRNNYEVLAAELAEVEITLNVTVVDHATMHEQIRQDVNPIVIYVAYRPSADAYLTRFFYSDSIVVSGAKPDTNFSHYSAIDDLILAARAEADPARQVQLWQEANIKILQDLAAFPLHYVNQVYGRRDTVDYGHELVSSLALYPQITELTMVNG